MTSQICVTRDVYLWCMAVIYLLAFTSLFVQIPGLYGDNGILPARLVLDDEAQTFQELVVRQPTLLRLLPSIGFDVQTAMDFVCLGGGVLAFVAIVSRDQRNCVVFAALWIFYLSLFQVGQTFLWFHWDVLLLEAGFLTILVAPLNCFGLHDSTWYHWHDSVSMLLVRWLLFRLTFASGLAKLASETSSSWWQLTELMHHYETQFLPTPFAWYFHHLPDWVQRLSAVIILASQTVGALFMLSPLLHQRLVVFYMHAVLLTLMMLTGNFGFYPLLAMTLSLSLVDDSWLSGWSSALRSAYKSHRRRLSIISATWQRRATIAFSVATSLIATYGIVTSFGLYISFHPISIQSSVELSQSDVRKFADCGSVMTAMVGACLLIYEILSAIYRSCTSTRLTPSRRVTETVSCVVVGLTASAIFILSLVPHLSITSQRIQSSLPQIIHDVQSWTCTNYRLTSPYQFHRRSVDEEHGRAEVIIEASENIETGWKEYNFRFKPGNISSRLPITSPHQPRLDCQMWFAARSRYQDNSWLLNLVYRLLTHQAEVLELIGDNPFQLKAPKYIRASLYTYHFTTPTADTAVGWWQRERIGDYLPVVSLNEPTFI